MAASGALIALGLIGSAGLLAYWNACLAPATSACLTLSDAAGPSLVVGAAWVIATASLLVSLLMRRSAGILPGLALMALLIVNPLTDSLIMGAVADGAFAGLGVALAIAFAGVALLVGALRSRAELTPRGD